MLHHKDANNNFNLKENLIVNQHGRDLKVHWLFNNLSLNQFRHLDKPLKINEQWIYLTGIKVLNSKNVIVATYQFDYQSMQVYAPRWTIDGAAFRFVGLNW